MNFSTMNDDEIMEAILEVFEEDGRLDLDDLKLEIVEGSLTINGRVSSEDEQQIIDEILEGIRFSNYSNNTWVDETLITGAGEADEEKNFPLSIGEGDDLEEDYQEDEEEEYDI